MRQELWYLLQRDEFPFGFISIDEPGISEMFASYFDNLVQSEYVYSIEETITKWEEKVEQIEREIEIEIEDRKE